MPLTQHVCPLRVHKLQQIQHLWRCLLPATQLFENLGCSHVQCLALTTYRHFACSPDCSTAEKHVCRMLQHACTDSANGLHDLCLPWSVAIPANNTQLASIHMIHRRVCCIAHEQQVSLAQLQRVNHCVDRSCRVDHRHYILPAGPNKASHVCHRLH
jgi:hypothetical protein